MISIRGAVTVTQNIKQDILEATEELLLEILKQNKLCNEDIISVSFTATRDLDQAYPAVAAREIGLTECSLICMQEMYVVDSIEKCIRVMLHVNSPCCQKDAKHVYLKEAVILRPDLTT